MILTEIALLFCAQGFAAGAAAPVRPAGSGRAAGAAVRVFSLPARRTLAPGALTLSLPKLPAGSPASSLPSVHDPVPVLPPSAVGADVGYSRPGQAGVSALAVPAAVPPKAGEAEATGMARQAAVLSAKSEALSDPLEASSGLNSPAGSAGRSEEEAQALGRRIWDIMSGTSGSGSGGEAAPRSLGRADFLPAPAFHGGPKTLTATSVGAAATARLADRVPGARLTRGERGVRGVGEIPAESYPSRIDAGLNGSRVFLEGAERSQGGVPLIAMKVVGLSLSLTDAGMGGSARRASKLAGAAAKLGQGRFMIPGADGQGAERAGASGPERSLREFYSLHESVSGLEFQGAGGDGQSISSRFFASSTGPLNQVAPLGYMAWLAFLGLAALSLREFN